MYLIAEDIAGMAIQINKIAKNHLSTRMIHLLRIAENLLLESITTEENPCRVKNAVDAAYLLTKPAIICPVCGREAESISSDVNSGWCCKEKE